MPQPQTQKGSAMQAKTFTGNNMQPQSNKSFVKVNRAFTLSPIYRSLSDNAKVIYQALRGYSDGNYKPCYPSQARLAEDTGKSTKTIERGVKELSVAKIITVQKNRTGSNFYYFVAEQNTEHPTNLPKAPDKSVGSVPVINKPTESPPSVTSKPIPVDKLPDKHPTNLSAKQELSFKLQNKTRKELVSMSKETFQEDFNAIKRLSPDGFSEEEFHAAYNYHLMGFICTHATDQLDDILKALGRQGPGYQQKLITFVGILAHGYSQDTIDNAPVWALSEFKKHFAKGASPKPIDSQFFLVASDLIYQQHHEAKERTEQVNARIKAEQVAKEKAVQNRMATAQNAPLELQQEAERLFPLYSDATLFDVRRAQILREEWICEQLKQKQGVA